MSAGRQVSTSLQMVRLKADSRAPQLVVVREAQLVPRVQGEPQAKRPGVAERLVCDIKLELLIPQVLLTRSWL